MTLVSAPARRVGRFASELMLLDSRGFCSLSDSSARAADKKKKKTAGSEVAASAAVHSNVFDTHGNDLLGLHMQTAQAGMKTQGADEEVSLLQLVSAQQQVAGNGQQVEGVAQQGLDSVERRDPKKEDEELLALRQLNAECDEETPAVSATSVAVSAAAQRHMDGHDKNAREGNDTGPKADDAHQELTPLQLASGQLAGGEQLAGGDEQQVRADTKQVRTDAKQVEGPDPHNDPKEEEEPLVLQQVADPERVVGDDDELAVARGISERHNDVDSGELKKTLLEGSGTEVLMQFMDDAQSELEMPPMNPDAQRSVVQQVGRQIDEQALVQAKDMDEVNEIMRQALRENALRAREEVILLLLRLTSSPQEMEAIGSLAERGDRAIQVIEYIAEYTAELDDLHALAAYDHRDLMHDIPVISTEAMEVRRYLSPLALHLGTFAPVLFQMIVNQLARTEQGGKVEEAAEGEQAETGPLQGAFLNVLNDMRLGRFLDG